MKIRVPASSANLGPGFDSFGLAWQKYNEITFAFSDELTITGCDARYADENNRIPPRRGELRPQGGEAAHRL